MRTTITVTVWNEFRHERNPAGAARKIYPGGIHEAIAAGLREHAGFTVRTATLDEPEHGLPASVLESTDVLLWWGHQAHDEIPDELVERVQQCVLNGMGLIVLH
ncbi:MAG: ThuA domain-containing protein, partial [Chloroflexota bacterium]|nr:ThuA domain-containing protein [Chloroflexota bacterium]